MHVVRAFEHPQVAHPHGAVDPVQDLETVEAELLLADLETAERRLEAATKAARSGDRERDRRARTVGADRRGAVRRAARARRKPGC